MIRPAKISPRWLTAVGKARDNQAEHPSAEQLLALAWEQGFGPVATARMLDWWCSCHPDVLKQNQSGLVAVVRPDMPVVQ